VSTQLVSEAFTRLSTWWSVLSRGAGTMEVLREFLETSTIHGLNYISTAKVRGWSELT
jgi:hypothetical protein